MDQNQIWESFGIKTDKQNPRALAVNTVLAGKYLVGPVLGEGGFGITYAGYDLNMETRIAIKEYFPVELVTRDTTRRSAGDGGAASGGSVSGSSVPGASASGGSVPSVSDGGIPSANGASVSGNLASASGPSADGFSSSGGGSDRVISLSGEKSKTYQQGLKKYVDEARNVSQFAGIPGIVSVKDFFYENNTAYIVMEYIEGISLKEYLKQKGGKLSEEESLAILRPVLEALEKVHAAGIVHRDISPDNIMLTFAEEGKTGAGQSDVSAVYGNISAVKLIDFGAARMTSKNDQKSLTIILKHGYAPEEQYRSHGEQGPWTDVYALCAVLYRMLTGKVPEPAMDRLFSDGLKRPEELGVKVTPTVSEAIMRGLAVKKEDRIQSVRELMDALYAGKKLKKRGNGKLSRPALVAAAASALVLVVAAVGIGMAFRNGNSGTTGAGPTELADGQEARENTDTAGNTGVESVSDMENGEIMSEMGENLPAEDILSLEEETKEEEWEIMVSRSPQTSCASGGGHAVFLREDGTVVSCGSNAYGQRNLSEWEHVAAVAAGWNFSAGLLENGTVVVEGSLEGKDDVERWEDITAIAAGWDQIFGLTADGHLLANKGYGENTPFLEWENIKSVTAFKQMVAALTRDGRVLCTAAYERTPAEISGWEDVTAIACDYQTVYGLCEDGTVKYADMWTDYKIEENESQDLENLQDVVQLFACNRTVLAVTEEGKTVCVVPEGKEDIPKEEIAAWEEVVGAVAADNGKSVAGMMKDGTLVKASVNSGNSEIETMTDLNRINIMDRSNALGNWDMAVVGITKEGELQTWGSSSLLSRFEWEGVENVQDITDAVYPYQDGSTAGYIWLDRNGTLYMSDLDDGQRSPVVENGIQMAVGNWRFDGYKQLCAVLLKDNTVTLLSTGGKDPEDIPEGFAEAENWEDITMLACCSGREDGTGILIGGKEDGTVEFVKSPSFPGNPDEGWNEIVSIHAGKYAIGAVKKDGTAIFLEDAPEYNYGQYNTSGWTDLSQLALGQYHTVGLRKDGTVYATGRNDAGQCEVEDWTDIVWITAGDSCTIGIRADGTLAVAGEIGW